MLNTIGIDKPILRDAPDLLRVDGSLRTNQGFQIAIPRGRYTMLASKVGVLEKVFALTSATTHVKVCWHDLVQ